MIVRLIEEEIVPVNVENQVRGTEEGVPVNVENQVRDAGADRRGGSTSQCGDLGKRY